MRKALSIVLVLVMVIFTLTACGEGETSSKVPTGSEASSNLPVESNGADASVETGEKLSGELVFWTMWNDVEAQGEVFQQIADSFMVANPDVTVKIQFCGREIGETITPALAGGEKIDVFDFPINSGVQEHCLDLSEFIKTSFPSTNGQAFGDTLMPALMELPKSQMGTDNLLAIGYQPWMCSFMYDADMFEELGVKAPSTWEELDAACAIIKAAGIAPITFDDAYNYMLPGMYLAREKGSDWVMELVQDNTGEMWRDEAVVKMAKAFEDFATKGYFDPNVNGNIFPSGQIDIGNGEAGMYYNATWLPNELAEVTGADFKWGAFAFPDTIAGETKSATEEACGSQTISINKNTENPELAMAFLAHVFAEQNDQLMAAQCASIPATKTAAWPVQLEDIKPAFEGITTMVPWAGNIDQNPDLSPVIGENFTRLAAGDITADQFVENIAKAAASN